MENSEACFYIFFANIGSLRVVTAAHFKPLTIDSLNVLEMTDLFVKRSCHLAVRAFYNIFIQPNEQ